MDIEAHITLDGTWRSGIELSVQHASSQVALSGPDRQLIAKAVGCDGVNPSGRESGAPKLMRSALSPC